MKKLYKYILTIIIPLAVIVAATAWHEVFRSNVRAMEPVRIFLPEGATFRDLVDTLDGNAILRNQGSFVLTARVRSLGTRIKPGSYLIEPGFSNYRLVNLFRAGNQSPVKVTFNNIRTLEELAGRIGRQIEADSLSLSAFFNDESNYSADGFTRETLISLFIPDTYELYWTTDAEGFYNRMLKEYNRFWSEERRQKASDEGLNPLGVSILASIIDDEVVMSDEKPRIAGVYLNRLRLGIPLQACPTIKYALNDFTIKRVLKKDMQVDSPYNTYMHKGLPPGPVRCPSRSGIEAVLNAEKHDYLYFVARYDFSGYHHFSRTLSEHNHYAALYQRELDKKRIYR